ncbi:MAG: ATP-grasp domain-containing protein [Azospirillum sp.]|nr:ATP-grasp domain-containing protein [Azospirillum sp.]
MTGNVLLTLGRLPKALDLARGFAEIGWRVFVAEPFKRHLAGASRAVVRSFRVAPPASEPARYLDELARIVAAERIDLVLPVSEETPHAAHLRGRLPAGTAMFTMPPDAVLRLHDKLSFARRAAAWGLGAPETHALGEPAAANLVRRGPVVVKPVHSCSGRGVRILPAGADLPPPDPEAPAIVQRFVAGAEYSSCSIAHDGRISSTVVYRAAQKSGSVAIAFERVAHPAIEDWIARFVAAERWTGFIAFDIVVDDSGVPWGIECNPRATSGLHFWRRTDLARAVLDPAHIPLCRPETVLQQFYPALTETQMSLFRGGNFAANLRRLLTTRDVSWEWRDPLPFLTMTATSWPIIRMAMARGVPFGEVATLDVGWYDARATAAAPAVLQSATAG